MNRFNLTFKGEILTGKDPERTRRRFGELIGIDDPARLEHYFSGETIVLREDLDTKAAAEYYSKLKQVGVEAELVKIGGEPAAESATAASTKAKKSTKSVRVDGSSQAEINTTPSSGQVSQRWAVSSRKQPPGKSGKPGAKAAPPKQAARAEKEGAARETARQKATREKAGRKSSASASRKATEAARRKARREEAASKKALLEEARRRAAEEKRVKAEEAARNKARQEEARRKAAEEKRKKAEEAARNKARQEEARRKAAEEKRKRAEEAARDKARREKAARVKALEEDAKGRGAAEATERKAGLAEQQRRDAQVAARNKAMEELAVQRAARELTRRPSLKPVEARVRTRLEVPHKRDRGEKGTSRTRARSRRQPGAPNYYSLRPFRNTQDIRTRVEQSRAAAQKGFVVAGLALACLFILGGRYLGLPAAIEITGPSAMAVAPGSGPALLAGGSLLLHDRAGVGSGSVTLAELGLSELAAPMLFNTAGELLAMARPGAGSTPVKDSENPGPILQRCNLEERSCQAFSAQINASNIGAIVEHPLTESLFLADLESGKLLKASSEGALLAAVDVPLPPRPVMHIQSGLLFMNSADGPAISVLRYDDSAFGQQLDEVLLLPPPAIAAEQNRVREFVKVADNWWVTLYNPDTNSAGVYRFDEQWNYIDQAEIPTGIWPQQLAAWADKLLIRDTGHLALQRFSAQGKPEVPLASDLLQELVGEQEQTRRLKSLTWRGGLAFLGFIAVLGFCLGSLHRIRGLVYRSHRERGADPLEDIIEAIQWIAPLPDRSAQIMRSATAYTALALVILSVAITLGVSVLQLSALLLMLSGPAIALVLLNKSPVGHIGILDNQLLLADHSDMYHLGGDARLQYRGRFLLIDDVVVFSGSRLLPAFAPEQIKKQVEPLTRAGIKVDRKTVLVKLLQSRHPLARGAIATSICLSLAVALLVIQ